MTSLVIFQTAESKAHYYKVVVESSYCTFKYEARDKSALESQRVICQMSACILQIVTYQKVSVYCINVAQFTKFWFKYIASLTNQLE